MMIIGFDFIRAFNRSFDPRVCLHSVQSRNATVGAGLSEGWDTSAKSHSHHLSLDIKL